MIKAASAWLAGVVLCLASTSVSAQAKALWEDYDKLIDSKAAVGALGPDLFGDEVNFYTGALSFATTDVSIPGNNALPVAVTRKFAVSNRKGYLTNELPFADWELDLPSISGVYTTGTGWVGAGAGRCSTPGAPPPIVFTTVTFPTSTYWYGLQMNLPGAGGGELMVAQADATKPTAGGPYYWVTSNQTYVSCLSEQDPQKVINGTGEGFLAVTADGTRYWFNWMATSYEPQMKQARRGINTTGYETISRRRYALYATRVEDRFGNWVKYTYTNAASSPVQISSIDSSDDRHITFSYVNGRVDTVTAGSQVWHYQYGQALLNGNSSPNYPTLSAVVLPDNSRWTIDFSDVSAIFIGYPDREPQVPHRNCFDPGDVDPTSRTASITHPSGATGTFTVTPTRLGRSNVLAICNGVTTSTTYSWGGWTITTAPNDVNDDSAYYPIAWDTFAVAQKQVTGPALVPATWNYTYLANISWFLHPSGNSLPICISGDCVSPQCTTDACAGKLITTVCGPDGEFNRYTFGNSYRYNEGKLLKTETGTSTGGVQCAPASVAKTTTTTYELAQSGLPFATPMAQSFQERSGSTFSDQYPRPQTSNVIMQDGVTFTSQVELGCTAAGVHCFDAFARPTKVTQASSLGFSRTDVTTYYDNISKWVLGQIASVTNTNTTPNVVLSRTEYEANAMPWKVYGPGTTTAAGLLQQTVTYNTTAAAETGQRGTISTVEDGRNNVTMVSGWKRGIPQAITYADGTSVSAVVDDNGWISSVTDEAKYKTCYGYDAMGRLSSVTYPSETAEEVCISDANGGKWAVTGQTFVPIATVEYGLPIGHWKQTVSTGNSRKISYFDALWRPVVEEAYDANVTGTRTLTVKRYDEGGKLEFQSYPLSSLASYADTTLTGTHHRYDALGRPVRSEQDSEPGLPTLVTTTEYLSGFKTKVTNPRLKSTTTSYQAFDQPNTDWPTLIEHPEAAVTQIDRDIFGKPRWIQRRDTTNSVSLTRSYTYNTYQQLCRTDEPETGATFMGYDLAGNLAWSASGYTAAAPGCTTSASVAARRADRTYDARNRLRTLVFPDHNGDQAWNYEADGAVQNITTLNEGGAVSIVNAYTYNHRRLLTGEAMTQGGTTWSLGYGYNSLGHQAVSLTQPGGEVLNFAPNALGQATKVTSSYGNYASNATYFPNGALKEFTYGNGIVHKLTQNARGLPERSWDANAGTFILDDSYDYDANGNVAAISDALAGNRGDRTMTYDGLDRLTKTISPMYATEADSEARYGYDVLDNLTTLHVKDRHHFYCYDANWRLTLIKTSYCSSGPAVIGLEYDAQGNLNNKNGQEFVFDYGNRLREATGKETYRYDGHGRRVMAHSLQGLGDIRSFYGQDGVLRYQWDDRQDKVFNHIYLAGSLVATRETPYGTSTNTIKYQHTDALGSPVAVTDSSGNVIERSEYEPFGYVLNRPAKDGPGYTGHVLDAATGLNYMQQRYYDPQIGRFLSVDPVTADGETGENFNRYWYANNNPYKFKDPDGRFGIVGALIGGAIEVGVQMLVEGKSLSQVDKTDVAVAMAVGAVTGGVGGRLATSAYRGTITAATAVRRTAAVGAAASASGSAAQSAANGEKPSAGKMALAAVAGAAGSAAGARVGTTGARTLERVAGSNAPGAVSMATTTQGVRAAAEATTTVGQQVSSTTADAAASAASKKLEERIR